MKEKYLLHVCCAPCGIVVIDELRKTYDLAVLFYNPNIHPEEEYLKRKLGVIQACEEWEIPMLDGDYEPNTWEKAVSGLEYEPEGGQRCSACFRFRLSRTAQIAAKEGFQFFGSTLTSGRNKRADVIHPIGEDVGTQCGVRFHAEDWKKCGRQERGRKMADERAVYRQNYCGCRYSMKH